MQLAYRRDIRGHRSLYAHGFLFIEEGEQKISRGQKVYAVL
jgi:hypothetical protein